MRRVPLLSWWFLPCFSVICAFAQRTDVSLEIQPPYPGTTLILKMNCNISSNTRRCLRELQPMSVKANGAELKYVITSVANQVLTLKLAQPLELEKTVSVRYAKNPPIESPPASVLPTAGDSSCCEFPTIGQRTTVTARIPTSAPLELIVVHKSGKSDFVAASGEHPKGDLQVNLDTRLREGDLVRITTGTGDARVVLASDTYHLEEERPATTQAVIMTTPPPAVVSLPACGPVSAGSLPAGFCAAPYIASAPGQVDSVTVVLSCLPADPEKDLAFCIDNKLQTVKWSLTGASPLTYTAKLSDKLKPGQAVKVLQRTPLQRDPDSPSQTVLGTVNPPETVLAVQEGATSVTGFAPGLDKVRIQVVDGSDIRAQQEAAVDSSTNQFSATFAAPLQADQQLNIYGISKGVKSDSPKQIEVAPLELDWGRVRAYFTAGVLLSNTTKFNATNANAFLGLNLDKGWLRPVRNLNGDSSWRERFRFHTYFDARLTAIPTPATGTSSPSSPQSASPTSSTSPTNPSPNASLLNNSQAASLQVGGYFPIVLANWIFKERPYSVYVAPLVKTGFYTVTNVGSDAYQTSISTGRNNDRFFTFEAYGVRLGQYREYSAADGRFASERAPEQLSFIDLTVGRWGNLEAIAPYSFITLPSGDVSCSGPAASVAAANCLGRYRPWRYGFEGMLKVPNTPIILGLNANINLERLKNPNFQMPPDDLRFLLGVRFDAGKLTSVLGKLGSQ
jgi:hypothetical protein